MLERTGSLVRIKFREYLVPALAMSASLYLAAIVDNIMVGRFLGGEAFAALNLSMPLIYINNLVFSIFIYGGNTLCAIFKGRRENENADKAFTFSVLYGTFAAVFMAAVGILLAPQTARLLSQGNQTLFPLVLQYIIPQWLVSPFVFMNSGSAAYVRTDGMTRLASALPIVSNAINLFLDYVYMQVFGWGLTGAALATVSGYAAGCLLLIFYFRSKKRTVHFARLKLSDCKIMLDTLSTGLPTALIHACNFFRSSLINQMVLFALGTPGLQTLSICLSVLNFALIFINGSATTLMPISGALYGEKDKKGVAELLRFSMILTIAMSAALALLFSLFPLQIGGLFMPIERDLKKMLKPALRLFSISLPFYAVAYIIRAFYQSTKKRTAASVFTILEGVVFILPAFWLFTIFEKNLVWLSYAIAEALSVVGIWAIMFFKNSAQTESNPDEEEEVFLDFTIQNDINMAEEASKKIQASCLAHGIEEKTAFALAVSTEELVVNAAKYAYKKDSYIDIALKKIGDDLLLRIRDNGIIFNPTEYVDDSGKMISGLSLAKTLTPDIRYNRLLGFNVTLIGVRLP